MFIVGNGRVAGWGMSLAAEGDGLGCSAGGGVGDRDDGEEGTENDGRSTGTTGFEERVASLVLGVVGFHRDGGHGEVCAVNGDHCRLSKTSSRVVFLDCWVNRDAGDDDEQNHVHGDPDEVGAAFCMAEKDVHYDGEDDGANVHSEGATNEDSTPELRVGFFNLVQACLRPGMCQIHQQDQSEK